MPSSRETLEKEALEKDRLESLANSRGQQVEELQSEIDRLRDWSNGDDANGVAIPSLIKIITDRASTTRQRLKAASTILNYRVEDSSVVDFTRRFLQSTCTDTGVATDYRVEAAELLRRHESPKIAPSTIRPDYRDDTPAEPVEPLRDLVARRRARQDRLAREAIEREMGLPPGGAAEISDPTAYLLRIKQREIGLRPAADVSDQSEVE